MEEGFIKIFRKFTEWEWFNDAYVVKAWIWMLLQANFRDKNWRGKNIKRGQFLTSVRHMADSLEMADKTVQSILKRLQSTGEINMVSDKKWGTLITICKYEDYQGSVVNDTTPTTTPLTTLVTTPLTTNIRNKESKNNTTTITKAREKLSTEVKLEMLRRFFSDVDMVSVISNLCRVDTATVQGCIVDLANEMKSGDKDDSETEADLLTHLKNYIRNNKRINETKQHGSYKQDSRHEGDTQDSRRGILKVTATKPSDYEGRF